MEKNLKKTIYVCVSLEKEMAPPSSILAWEIPWTEEPSGLQPMGLHESWLNNVCVYIHILYIPYI